MAGSRWYIWAAIIFAALFVVVWAGRTRCGKWKPGYEASDKGVRGDAGRKTGHGYRLRKGLLIWLIFVLVGIAGYCNMMSLRTQETFAECAAGAVCEVRGKIYDSQETASGWMLQLYASQITVYDDAAGAAVFSGQMKMIAYLTAPEKPVPGEMVVLKGVAALPEAAVNPGGFDALEYYKAKRIFLMLKDSSCVESDGKRSVLLSILYGIRERITVVYDRIFNPKEASVLSAIILGDKRGLDKDAKNMYQLNGIAHILAISGLHIAILGMTLFEWLRKRTGSYRLAGWSAMSVVVLYGIMTGLSGSTSRAVIMMGLLILAKAKGRSVDLLTSAGIAGVCMAVWNPYVIRDAGFQLSFSAVAGLAVIRPVLVQAWGDKGRLRQAFFVSLSSFLATLPVSVYYYYQIPLYGVFLNLLIVPFVSGVLMSALVTGGCGMLSMSLAKFTGIPAHFILTLYEWLCRLSEKLPYSSINTGHISVRMLLVYYAGLCLSLLILKYRYCTNGKNEKEYTGRNRTDERLNVQRTGTVAGTGTVRRGSWLLAAGLVILMTGLYEYASLDRSFVTAFLDVGQGDGILIRTEQGTSILIDGGSTSNQSVGEYVLLPALRYYGMAELDYVFVTHGDADHISGIEYLMKTEHTGVKIRNIIFAKYGDRQGLADIEALAEKKGIHVCYMEVGDRIMEKHGTDMAGLKLECLYPDKENAETGLEANDRSLVLLAEYEGRKLLFTGDAGCKMEEKLLSDRAPLSSGGYNSTQILLPENIDVLKVGHHGSRSASSELFLQTIRPQYAVISCGERNRYGHPHEETLANLHTVRAEIYRTDKCGAVILKIEKGQIVLKGYSN